MSEKKKNENQKKKIIPFQIDPGERLDEELESLLAEDLMREADEIEAQLNSDPDLVGVGASDDLFLKIIGELKEKGVWEEEEPQSVSQEPEEPEGEEEIKKILQEMEELDLETLYAMMPEEDRRALEVGRKVEQEQELLRQKKEQRQKTRKRLVKRGGTLVAVLALVFGVSMTSDANRRLVSQAWDTVIMNFGLRMTSDYVDEDKIVRSRDKDEIADFQKVSSELGIPKMDLGYLPNGMKYLRCEIDEGKMFATMFYSYNEKIFRITMIKNEEEGVFYYTLDNQTQLDTTSITAQEVEAVIGKTDTTEETGAYVASMEYENCNYYLEGIISLGDMEKIVNNIYFL